jgi:hypothetical protein
VIVAAGGSNTRSEALHAVRQRLPLIVVEGSGGVADEIAAAWHARPALPADSALAEIIADGRITLHLLSDPTERMARLIMRSFDNVLLQAWEHYSDYDLNAGLQRKTFDRLQVGILALGVLGTALALIQQVYGPPKGNAVDYNSVWWWLHKFLIIVPILLTVLITAVNRFKQGNKWLLLRASGEAIKREIYRYRTRSTYYMEEEGQPTPDQQLSKKVEDITRRAMRTEVNTSALAPYDKAKGFPPYMWAVRGGDDGFSLLTPDRYVEVRLTDQLNYFKKTAIKLELQVKRLQWLIFIIGGLGSFLAAVNQQVWIALTTAVVAALTTYLAYRQTESSLMKYNQAGTDLDNVKAWWMALSSEEQARQENIDSLVDHTEQVLEAELGGWVQQMQNALAELRKEQTPATESRAKDEAGKNESKKPATTARSGKPDEKKAEKSEEVSRT